MKLINDKKSRDIQLADERKRKKKVREGLTS
jgi:hypothetical protein